MFFLPVTQKKEQLGNFGNISRKLKEPFKAKIQRKESGCLPSKQAKAIFKENNKKKAQR